MSILYKEGYQGGDGDLATARIVMIIVSFLGLWAIAQIAFGPIYSVWSSGKAGEAELAQAEYNRQIIVRQAQAKRDAAELEAEAEVTRAEGVAKANAIIGDSLKNNEAYLRYLFVNNLAETKDQVIYVPTEANLPVLEAGKRTTITN